jgi:hypothetical protein
MIIAARRWPRTASAAVPLFLGRSSSSRAAVIIPARLGSTRFPGEDTLARPRRVYLSFSVLLGECAVERGRTLRPVPTMCPQESPSRRSAASLSSSTRCGLPRRSAVSFLCFRIACAPLLQWPEREGREEREEREKRKRRETRERENREKREKREKERQRVSATTLLRCETAVGRRDEKRFEQQRTIPCVHAR